MAEAKVSDRPLRVLLIAGSDRRQYDCPGVDSKARSLMFRMADRLPREWEIDREDLGNVWNREQIRTCNACLSTSMALCVWPCNCYKKGQPGSARPDVEPRHVLPPRFGGRLGHPRAGKLV